LSRSTVKSSSSRSAAAKPAASARTPNARPQRGGEPLHDVQVPLDHRGDAGPLHLDHHLGAVRQPRGVHLGDRRGGDRLRVDRGERLAGRPAQLGGQYAGDVGPRHRRRLVLQGGQLVGELGGQQLAPRGQHLAQLDEGHAALVQRRPQRPGQRAAAGRRGRSRAGAAAQEPAQAVAQRDPDDRRVAPGPGEPAPGTPGDLQRSRQRPGRQQHLEDHQRGHGQQRGDHHGGDQQQARLAAGHRRRVGRAERGQDRLRDHHGQHRGQQGPDRADPDAEQPPDDRTEQQHGHHHDRDEQHHPDCLLHGDRR
jgi:hypothetical protein